MHLGLLKGIGSLVIVTNLDSQVSDGYYHINNITLYTYLASQMWLLGRLLPLMVGDCVPMDDPHWICFVNLLRIMCIVTAVEITQDAVAVLHMLIEDYLCQFDALYPDSITPKLHYLLHLLLQILQY